MRGLALWSIGLAAAALAACPKPAPKSRGPDAPATADAGPVTNDRCREAAKALAAAESEDGAGRLLAVRDLTEKAWTICPTPESALARAQALEALWLREQAEAAYRDYAEIDPSAKSEADAAIARLADLPAPTEKANLERVRKARLLLQVGHIRTREKAYDRALADFDKAYGLWGHPTCVVSMATALEQKGDAPGAQRMYARAVAQAESAAEAAATPQIDTLYVGSINDVDLDADGKLAAIALHSNAVLLWDLKAKRAVHLLTGHRDQVNDVDLSPSGDLVASASDDGATVVWDVITGQELYRFETVSSRETVAFHPDGARVYSGGDDGVIRIHTLAEGAKDRYLLHHEGEIWAMDTVAVGTGGLLATGDGKNHVKVWRLDDPETPADEHELLHEIEGHTSSIWEVAFRPLPAIGAQKHVLLATGGHDKTARLWSIPLGAGKPRLLHVLKGHTDGIGGLAFSPGGDQLATGSHDETIRIWDLDTGKTVYTLKDPNGHDAQVRHVIYEPSLGDLYAGDDGGKLLRWSPGSGQLVGRVAGGDSYLRWGEQTPDGTKLALGLVDGRVLLIQPGDDPPIRSIEVASDSILDLSFSPDGARLATISKTKLRVHEMGSGEEVFELELPAEPGDVAFTPAGRELLVTGDDGSVVLRGANDGKTRRELAPGGGKVPSYKIGFVGERRAVITTDEGRVHLWDLEKGQPLRSHTLVEKGWFFPLAVSPDRSWFAAAGEAGVVGRWKTDSGAALPPLHGARLIRGIGISPDGKRLAAVGDDRVVRIWNTETGALVSTHFRHQSPARSAFFSRDGTQLYTADRSGVIAIHDLTGEKPVHTGSLYAGEDGAWVVASADGRVEDDPKGRGRASLSWHAGDVALPARVLWEARETPGLLRELMKPLAATPSSSPRP